jgi:hypothetical protein
MNHPCICSQGKAQARDERQLPSRKRIQSILLLRPPPSTHRCSELLISSPPHHATIRPDVSVNCITGSAQESAYRPNFFHLRHRAPANIIRDQQIQAAAAARAPQLCYFANRTRHQGESSVFVLLVLRGETTPLSATKVHTYAHTIIYCS